MYSPSILEVARDCGPLYFFSLVTMASTTAYLVINKFFAIRGPANRQITSLHVALSLLPLTLASFCAVLAFYAVREIDAIEGPVDPRALPYTAFQGTAIIYSAWICTAASVLSVCTPHRPRIMKHPTHA